VLAPPPAYGSSAPRLQTPATAAMVSRRSLYPMAVSALLPVALLLLATAASALSWRTSSDAVWAPGCDFPSAADIGRRSVRGEDCSGACGRVSGCTHFVWSRGTCYFKGGPISRGAAFSTSVPGAVCGVMKGAAATPTVPSEARRFVPIFRFDDGAGDSCFPDDKRKISSRDGNCAAFRRNAPVFVSTATCGDYTVFKYNLWYGKQLTCFLNFGRGTNDNEYVEVWLKGGAIAWVGYYQHNGLYYRRVKSNGSGMAGNRPVVHIGKNSHGAYHWGCTGNPFSRNFCTGGCAYWDDFRNSRKGRYVLDQPVLYVDPTPRAIDCNAPVCTKGHSKLRLPANSACYGVERGW